LKYTHVNPLLILWAANFLKFHQGSEKFASDVEAEANMYFQQVYRGVRSVEDVVTMLQTFRSSPVPREQEVFACMLHNLFDEYKFFSRYPDKVGQPIVNMPHFRTSYYAPMICSMLP
jgi:hypothetical protein